MGERGYSERMWRMRGWKGMVHDIIDKAFRLRFRAWEQNSFDEDSPRDMINFCCYYLRLRNSGKRDGARWGIPDGQSGWIPTPSGGGGLADNPERARSGRMVRSGRMPLYDMRRPTRINY